MTERSVRRADVWQWDDGWRCKVADAQGDGDLMGCTPAWSAALREALPAIGYPHPDGPTAPRAPQGRKGAVLAPLPGTRAALAFGGWGETYELLKDAWVLALPPLGAEASAPPRWLGVSTSENDPVQPFSWRRAFYGDAPPAREMAAACALGPGSALLHGGRSVQGAPLADAWRFELVS